MTFFPIPIRIIRTPQYLRVFTEKEGEAGYLKRDSKEMDRLFHDRGVWAIHGMIWCNASSQNPCIFYFEIGSSRCKLQSIILLLKKKDICSTSYDPWKVYCSSYATNLHLYSSPMNYDNKTPHRSDEISHIESMSDILFVQQLKHIIFLTIWNGSYSLGSIPFYHSGCWDWWC